MNKVPQFLPRWLHKLPESLQIRHLSFYPARVWLWVHEEASGLQAAGPGGKGTAVGSAIALIHGVWGRGSCFPRSQDTSLVVTIGKAVLSLLLKMLPSHYWGCVRIMISRWSQRGRVRLCLLLPGLFQNIAYYDCSTQINTVWARTETWLSPPEGMPTALQSACWKSWDIANPQCYDIEDLFQI